MFDVSNQAVNEVLAGRATRVAITLTPDGGVRVAVDGPGVPFEDNADLDGPGLRAQLTQTYVGPRTLGRDAALVGWLHVGLFVATALSSRLTAEVRHGGVRKVQEYVRSVAVAPPAEVGPADDSGTVITFWPDADIFETTQVSSDTLVERFRELAFLNRGLDISLSDERRPAQSRSVQCRFLGGARDFVAFLDQHAGTPVDPETISFERQDERMAGTMEVAFRWRNTQEERFRTFANSHPTLAVSTHDLGFRDGLAAAVSAYAREQRRLTASDPDLQAGQIVKGLTAVVSVKLDHPEFEGATRGALANTAVQACVEEATREHLGHWLREHPKRAEAVLGRILHDVRRD
ncbi:DNA gyrase subunit B [Streptacidiphilus sp. MAP12-20]|uniref:DNA gyrase subunit B n=1 Tax=Streptacidiphilus sp. MAP12-20 TaxID=3156299 RepID=UPI0035164008